MTTPTDLGLAFMGASPGGEMSEDHIGRAVPGWQGMDSAAGDGEPVLIATRSGVVGEARYFADEDAWWWAGFYPTDYADGQVDEPAAWMPLPDPPEVTG